MAMAPFLTDQLIGASDELSTVVRWYFWIMCAGVTFYVVLDQLTCKIPNSAGLGIAVPITSPFILSGD